MARKATGTAKTTPDIRDEASENVFAKDYLVYVDDSSKVSDELIERNKLDVETSALQRGLRPTGDVKLESKEVVDDRNVKLVYTVTVEPNEADTK